MSGVEIWQPVSGWFTADVTGPPVETWQPVSGWSSALVTGAPVEIFQPISGWFEELPGLLRVETWQPISNWFEFNNPSAFVQANGHVSIAIAGVEVTKAGVTLSLTGAAVAHAVVGTAAQPTPNPTINAHGSVTHAVDGVGHADEGAIGAVAHAVVGAATVIADATINTVGAVAHARAGVSVITTTTVFRPFDPYAPIVGQVMQTQIPYSPFTVPTGCGPGRQESVLRMQVGGKLYTFTFRDKIVPEDPYLVAVQAAAFAIARTEPYRGTPPARNVRDFLIKNNVII